METRNKSFSAVICTVNNYDGLVKCLDSIESQLLIPDEVVVVHSGDYSNTHELISDYSNRSKIRYIYINMEKSLVLQRNKGIDSCDGDIIFFIDDDAILDKLYFNNIMKFYGEHWHDSLGGVQGTINEHKYLKPNLFNIFRKIFFLSVINGSGKLQRSGYPSFLHYSPLPKRVEIFHGCMMSFKREILEKDNFDLQFTSFWLGDDFELSYRISRNFRLYQIPDATMSHTPSSPTTEGLEKIWKMDVYNRWYIFKKYFNHNWINYLAYSWSFIGVMLVLFAQSIKSNSLKPIRGFYSGVCLLIGDFFK